MKKTLLFSTMLCFASLANAQVSFNNVLFSQNFQGTVEFTGANNTTDMGTFNDLAVAANPANKSIVSDGLLGNKVLKIERPQTANSSAPNNNYVLQKNMSFTAAAPERIKLAYTLRYNFTSAAPATGNLTSTLNFVQIITPDASSSSTGFANSLYNLSYSARRTTTSNFFFTTLDTTTPGNTLATDSSKYVWFINNGASTFTYTDPNSNPTAVSLSAGKIDIWVKLGSSATFTMLSTTQSILAQTVGAATSFGGFKISSNSNSYSSGGAPLATDLYVDNISVSTADASTLPISLTSLTGKANGKTVQINWSTASEINNNKYEVQRSNAGKNFTTIGSLKGAGTSNNINNYTFNDENPAAGTNYYRLKQYDFDGTISTSETIAVKSNVAESTISVSSNGVQTDVQIMSANSTSASLYLYDINGRKLADQNVSLTTGFNKIIVNSSLTPGIYFIKLIDGGKVITQKFAVQ